MSQKIVLLALVVVGCILSSWAAQLPVPLKAIYIDYKNIDYNNPNNTLLAAAAAGYNMIIMAFYLSASGPADFALVWSQTPAAVQISTMNALHAQNVFVIVSFGGGTDSPYGLDPATLGTTIGNWCVANHLDGVDFDLENLAAGFTAGTLNSAQTVNWIATISSAARAVIGPNRFISHAPQAPYFGPIGATNTFPGPSGGYSAVYQQFPDIDMFFVQFYNQGTTCYVDYPGSFQQSCTNFPSTSVGEINKLCGIPLSKIIFGKPVTATDAGNGYLPASTINQFLVQANAEMGFNSGAFGWVWGDPATLTAWVNGVFNGIAVVNTGSLSGSGLIGGKFTPAAVAGIVVLVVLAVATIVGFVLYGLVKEDIIDTHRIKRKIDDKWDAFKSKLPGKQQDLPK